MLFGYRDRETECGNETPRCNICVASDFECNYPSPVIPTVEDESDDEWVMSSKMKKAKRKPVLPTIGDESGEWPMSTLKKKSKKDKIRSKDKRSGSGWPSALADLDGLPTETPTASTLNWMTQIRETLLAVKGYGSEMMPEHQYAMSMSMPWQNLSSLKGYGYDFGRTEPTLDDIITITGQDNDAELCTVRQYILRNWPKIGAGMLTVINAITFYPQSPLDIPLNCE